MTQVIIPLSNRAVIRRVDFLEVIRHPTGRFPDNHEILDEVWDWCEANLQGTWHWVSDREAQARILVFSDPRSAVLFKLRWGGR
jgi:hypothetical protein